MHSTMRGKKFRRSNDEKKVRKIQRDDTLPLIAIRTIICIIILHMSIWGYFTINVLPGIGFLQINNRDSNESAGILTFALKAAFGYEIQYKKVTFKFNFNYTYLIDVNVAFHGIGGSFGMAFRLW